MYLQQRIAEAIENSEYSQKEIAQKLNIKASNISNWEKGKYFPSIDIFYKLCLILDESADYLLGLKDR